MSAWSRAILHVDMDAFFASVEVRDDPGLANRPVLVGGTGRRGVVAAASYEARRYGCRSAQPMAIARRLCPDAVVLAPRFSVYAEVSRVVFDIFAAFTPLVEPLSIDEAFLDLTGTQRLWGEPREAAERIRARVRSECGITCSVGISTVKFIAKIASAKRKPDAVTEVAPGTEVAFLGPLPVEELWGVGPKTAEQLRARGLRTVADLRRVSRDALMRQIGDERGRHLHALAHAIDPRPVVPDRRAKQLSVEDTYVEDLVGCEAIRARLVDQATRLADRLVRAGAKGRTVVLKLRDASFTTITRQRRVATPVSDARTLIATVYGLLGETNCEGRAFRLTGVGVADLEFTADAQTSSARGDGVQLGLAFEEDVRPDKLQEVLSAVRHRFGADAMRIAGGERNTEHDRAMRGAKSRRFTRRDSD